MCWKHETLQFVCGVIAVSRPVHVWDKTRTVGIFLGTRLFSNFQGYEKSSRESGTSLVLREHVIWGCREPPTYTRGGCPIR
jgi:hypothetical protein